MFFILRTAVAGDHIVAFALIPRDTFCNRPGSANCDSPKFSGKGERTGAHHLQDPIASVTLGPSYLSHHRRSGRPKSIHLDLSTCSSVIIVDAGNTFNLGVGSDRLTPPPLCARLILLFPTPPRAAGSSRESFGASHRILHCTFLLQPASGTCTPGRVVSLPSPTAYSTDRDFGPRCCSKSAKAHAPSSQNTCLRDLAAVPAACQSSKLLLHFFTVRYSPIRLQKPVCSTRNLLSVISSSFRPRARVSHELCE